MPIFWMHTIGIYVMLTACLVHRAWRMRIIFMVWLRNAD